MQQGVPVGSWGSTREKGNKQKRWVENAKTPNGKHKDCEKD